MVQDPNVRSENEFDNLPVFNPHDEGGNRDLAAAFLQKKGVPAEKMQGYLANIARMATHHAALDHMKWTSKPL